MNYSNPLPFLYLLTNADRAFFTKLDKPVPSQSLIACKSDFSPTVLLSSIIVILLHFVLSFPILAYFYKLIVIFVRKCTTKYENIQFLRQNYFFMATHHDINNAVLLEFNEKRIEKLKAKQQPKTKIDRQRSFYYLLLVVAILCELVDCILTFSGIIHFSANRLSDNGFWLFGLIGLCVVVLSVFKHKTMDIFHAQRLDDGHVPKSTYAFMFVFFLVSAAATYNVTPAALEYLTKTPPLSSVDSVSLRFDSLLAADMVVIAKEIETHGTTAKAIHKASNWKGKLDLNSQTKYENALTNKNEATAKKTAVVLARNAEKEAAINLVTAKNEATIQEHKDWCVSFGFWLSIAFVLVELMLYPARWFCENYERLEVIEAKAKENAKGQSVKGSDIHTPTNTPPLPSKNAKGKREKVFSSPNLAPTMQFKQGEPLTNSNEPKEGDILPPVGRGVHRALIEVNGKLDARTKGQLRTLKAAQGNDTSERSIFIQKLIDTLP